MYMQNITLSTYPMPLSRICLGTATMGNMGLTGEPLEKAFHILDAYYALGGRFLDTANVYGRWGVDKTNASEKVIGRWLHERQITDMVITTKACHYMPDTPQTSRVDAAAMAVDVEDSRRSLGLDTLPICLLHRDNTAVDIRTIVDFCVAHVDSGEITRFGFSNYSTDRVQAALTYLGADWQHYFVGVSNEWSLAMEGAEQYTPANGMAAVEPPLVTLSKQMGFGIFPFSSIAHGFFTKLQRCGAAYADGKWKNTEDFPGNRAWLTAKNGEMYNRLCHESVTTGVSIHILCLRFLTAQPNTIPVMSVSRVEQLAELLQA